MMSVHCWAIHSRPEKKNNFCFLLPSPQTPSGSFMVEIWDDWRRRCSWGDIQPKDNVCARCWHLSAAGASGTDAAPVIRLRAEALPGLSRVARLHQRLQLHGRAVQSARHPGCGEKGQLQQGGADRASGGRPAAQQDRYSVSWNSLTTSEVYHCHSAVAYRLTRALSGGIKWLLSEKHSCSI